MNTFLVVTFAWSLVLAFFVLSRLFRCKHAWELVDKTQLPSKLEEMRKFWTPSQMQVEQVITASKVCATLVIRCPLCGNCKIIKMSNED